MAPNATSAANYRQLPQEARSVGGKKRCVSFLFRPKDTPGEGEGLVSCQSPQWQGGQDGGGHAVVWEGPGKLWLLTDKASDREPKKNPSYTVFVQTEPLPARCLGFNLTTQGDTAGLQAVERQRSPAKPCL